MKHKIWHQLSLLRDSLPAWIRAPIDWLRYEVFYPYD